MGTTREETPAATLAARKVEADTSTAISTLESSKSTRIRTKSSVPLARHCQTNPPPLTMRKLTSHRHCVGEGESEGGESSQPDCGTRTRDYNIGLRVGLLFVIMATSALGT